MQKGSAHISVLISYLFVWISKAELVSNVAVLPLVYNTSVTTITIGYNVSPIFTHDDEAIIIPIGVAQTRFTLS